MVAWCQETSRTIPPSQLLQVHTSTHEHFTVPPATLFVFFLTRTAPSLAHSLQSSLTYLTSDPETIRLVRACSNNYSWSAVDTPLSRHTHRRSTPATDAIKKKKIKKIDRTVPCPPPSACLHRLNWHASVMLLCALYKTHSRATHRLRKKLWERKGEKKVQEETRLRKILGISRSFGVMDGRFSCSYWRPFLRPLSLTESF